VADASPGPLDEAKPWFQSRTVLASIAGAVVSLLGILGVVWRVDVDQLANALAVLLPLVVTLGTSLAAWYARVVATRRIGPAPAIGGVPPDEVRAKVTEASKLTFEVAAGYVEQQRVRLEQGQREHVYLDELAEELRALGTGRP
jgi:hypothetical protein